MNSPEFEKVAELTEQLLADGFRVIVEPKIEDLPFSLSPYRPDLVAFKNDGGLVIEVKRSMKRAPVSYFREISERVANHRGWQFALVTLDNPLSSNFEECNLTPLDISTIKKRIEKLNSLEGMQFYTAEVQETWSLIEACLRLIAYSLKMPLALSQPTRLINHLYSEGELAMEQTDQLKKLMSVRNNVAHGMPVQLSGDTVAEFTDELSKLVGQIEAERANKKV